MSKAILEFELPEESEEFDRAINGGAFLAEFINALDLLRSVAKFGRKEELEIEAEQLDKIDFEDKQKLADMLNLHTDLISVSALRSIIYSNMDEDVKGYL